MTMTLNSRRLWIVWALLGLASSAVSADPFPTPDDLKNVPADKPYVLRDKFLLVNLALARTPDDWLKIPGVKGAWRNFGLRGKTVLHDVDGDGQLEVVVQQPGCASRGGDFHIIDGRTGAIERKVPNRPVSHVQCFAAGRFCPERPGLQLAVTTVGGLMLRMIDCPRGEYLPLAPGTPEPAELRWRGLDMYNCAAHDADGDGRDEVVTFTTPKPHQLKVPAQPTDPHQALAVGVAAFRGDGSLAQYWNFYEPAKSGIRWGVHGWEMRQFQSPVRRFDVDHNGIEEIYLETSPWILLMEIPAARPRAAS